tara:strand:- start:5625 stop:6068 length:444 start_codon:yes stop_codon:yes gene_type:complete
MKKKPYGYYMALMLEAKRKNVAEGEYAQKKSDIRDAKEVFYDYVMERGHRLAPGKGRGDYDHHFDKLSNVHKTEKIPLDKINTFADFGRRVKEPHLRTPAILLKVGDSYETMDGQHRKHTLKDNGETHMDASVVEIPHRLGRKVNFE